MRMAFCCLLYLGFSGFSSWADDGLKIVLKDGSVETATTGLAIEDNMLLYKNANGDIVKMSKMMVDWQATRRVSPKVFAIAAPDDISQGKSREAKSRERRDIVIDNSKLEAMDEDTGLIREATFIEVAPVAARAVGGGTVRTISTGEKVDVKKYLVAKAFTIVDFYADWCGPCRILTPELEDFVKQHPTKAAMRKVDIKTFESEVAKQYEIESIPHVYIFDDSGSIFFRGNGFEALEKLKAHAQQAKW